MYTIVIMTVVAMGLFTYVSGQGPLLLTWFNFNPSMDE